MPTASTADADAEQGTPPFPPLVQGSTIAEPLLDPDERAQMGLPTADDDPMTMIVELNLRHSGGLTGAREQFDELYTAVFDRTPEEAAVITIADIYLRCWLSLRQAQALVTEDVARAKTSKAPGSRASKRAIYRIWPDFPVRPF